MRKRADAVRRSIVRRLGDESGIALILALMVLIVMSVTVASVLTYSSSGGRTVRFAGASNRAYGLAEAGINDAFSVIGNSGMTAAIKPAPQYAGDPNSTVTTLPGSTGTVTWGGSFNSSTRVWTITSIGSIPNPSGAAAVSRTVNAQAQVVAPPYQFASLDTGCDQHSFIIQAAGQLTVTNPIYVNSCNPDHDAFDVFGAGGTIVAPAINVVGGWETHNGNLVKVNGVTCPLQNSNPPATPTAGCPVVGSPSIGDPYAGKISPPAAGAPACTYSVYGTAASYAPVQKLTANITAAQTTITVNGTAIHTGDVVQIENEDLLVTGGGGTTTLAVQRGYNGTTAAAHTGTGPGAKEVKHVPVSTAGSAATPGPCNISSGTVTLNPGTYYGGICIGAASGATCGSNVGGTCTTTSSSTAHVTLNAGTYIMAGGGFFVCGSSTLSAPNVMIYNTQDSSNTAGSGAIDSIELDTTGSVSLGPQTSGTYIGMTIYQDPNLIISNAICNQKNSNQYTSQDIVLLSMASTGANGALGSISGTIYAPANTAIFDDSVSGTANLAVLTSCLEINGATSTFAFQTNGLYASQLQILKEWS